MINIYYYYYTVNKIFILRNIVYKKSQNIKNTSWYLKNKVNLCLNSILSKFFTKIRNLSFIASDQKSDFDTSPIFYSKHYALDHRWYKLQKNGKKIFITIIWLCSIDLKNDLLFIRIIYLFDTLLIDI